MEKRMHIQEEAARCLLCADAPCSSACKKGDPARAIRAVRFGNADLALRWVAECSDEDFAEAERACIHYDRAIRIGEMFRIVGGDGVVADNVEQRAEGDLPSLAIDFCGIRCENPFFLASSAICTNYEMVARAFDAGWAGVFYKTICLDEIREVSPRFDAVADDGTSDFFGF